MSKNEGKQEKIRFVKKTKPAEAQGAKLTDADLEKVSGGLGGSGSGVECVCGCKTEETMRSLSDTGIENSGTVCEVDAARA